MPFKYKIIALLLFCSSVRVFSQNLPYYDDKLIHFGFSLGLNMMHANVTPSMLPQLDGETYMVRCSGLTPGFSVGGIVDLRLARNLNLRCTPTFHFGQYGLSYKKENTSDDSDADWKYDVKPMPISIPLHLKFSANRIGNYRPYIIGGGGVMFDVGRDKEKAILLNPMDYFVEVGFGCDTYFSFFKFAPEIKFSFGFNNMITPMAERPSFVPESDKMYTEAVTKLLSRMVTLTFNFE